jgi:hypothetical protein
LSFGVKEAYIAEGGDEEEIVQKSRDGWCLQEVERTRCGFVGRELFLA